MAWYPRSIKESCKGTTVPSNGVLREGGDNGAQNTS
jgi:hypothetical protein